MYTHYRMAVAANARKDVFEDSLSENNGMQSSGCINTIKVGGGKCSCAEFDLQTTSNTIRTISSQGDFQL